MFPRGIVRAARLALRAGWCRRPVPAPAAPPSFVARDRRRAEGAASMIFGVGQESDPPSDLQSPKNELP